MGLFAIRRDSGSITWRAGAAVVVSTLALTVEHYHHILPLKSYDRLLCYFVVPLLVIVLVFRQSPTEYGLQIGDWRAGLAFTVAACAGLAVLMNFVASTPAFSAYYAPLRDGPLPLPLYTAAELFGWEFLFRGFLLFALYPVCGPLAILIQAVPFTVAHFGKPELETLSCIFGGSAFGYVAWRTRSFLYPFLIHWFLTTYTIIAAAAALH